MVNDSNTKMASFRSAVRAFKQGESTAKGMIDTIYNVLDRDTQATLSVIKEIGQIFEQDGEKDKAKSILEAFNGFRAEVCHLSPVHHLHLSLDSLLFSRNSNSPRSAPRAVSEPDTPGSLLVQSSEPRMPPTPRADRPRRTPSGPESKLLPLPLPRPPQVVLPKEAMCAMSPDHALLSLPPRRSLL